MLAICPVAAFLQGELKRMEKKAWTVYLGFAGPKLVTLDCIGSQLLPQKQGVIGIGCLNWLYESSTK